MRRHITIHWNNGDITETEINGNSEEITNYYMGNDHTGKQRKFVDDDENTIYAIDVVFNA